MKTDNNIMTTVDPASSLCGEVAVPGDKSISHRAVMLGSISEGQTVITGFLEGEDNLSTIAAFKNMGVAIKQPEKGSVVIDGVGLDGLTEPGDVIDAGNSGTTARLLSGILAGSPFFSVLTGDASLRTRPMARVVEPLQTMGAAIVGRDADTLLPLAFLGGGLKGITYESPVASAQVKSAVLLAGLYASGETSVVEPGLSRDHTERMLSLFGVNVERDGTRVTIKEGALLKGTNVEVPGDISSAAFFIVAALITKDSELLIKNVGINPTRCGIIEILKKMGGDIELINERDDYEPIADIIVKSSNLAGITICGSELLPAIDEFPILCIAAALASGRTVITGALELRVKESDRISAMACMLSSLGVEVSEKDDGIEIEGNCGALLTGATVETCGDHRIAMSAAVAALASTDGVAIKDASSVDISFPGFFELLGSVVA